MVDPLMVVQFVAGSLAAYQKRCREGRQLVSPKGANQNPVSLIGSGSKQRSDRHNAE